MFNAEIRKFVSSEIEIPDFAEVCKHKLSSIYTICSCIIVQITKGQILDIECNSLVCTVCKHFTAAASSKAKSIHQSQAYGGKAMNKIPSQST